MANPLTAAAGTWVALLLAVAAWAGARARRDLSSIKLNSFVVLGAASFQLPVIGELELEPELIARLALLGGGFAATAAAIAHWARSRPVTIFWFFIAAGSILFSILQEALVYIADNGIPPVITFDNYSWAHNVTLQRF